MDEQKIEMSARKDAFASVAFWQLMAFVLLICVVWAIEVLDLPRLIFGADPSPFDLFRVCLVSAAIITAAIVTVGHTYEQQRGIINNLLKACLYCHRIQGPNGSWEHVEEYFMKYYPISLERGPCPDCEKMLNAIDTRVKAKKSASGAKD